MDDTVKLQLALAQMRNRAKFPNNSALPRVGNNRPHVHKSKARLIKAQQEYSRAQNR